MKASSRLRVSDCYKSPAARPNVVPSHYPSAARVCTPRLHPRLRVILEETQRGIRLDSGAASAFWGVCTLRRGRPTHGRGSANRGIFPSAAPLDERALQTLGANARLLISIASLAGSLLSFLLFFLRSAVFIFFPLVVPRFARPSLLPLSILLRLSPSFSTIVPWLDHLLLLTASSLSLAQSLSAFAQSLQLPQ